MSHSSPIAETRHAIVKALEESLVADGHDEALFRKKLGTHRSRKLDGYVLRENVSLGQLLSQMTGVPTGSSELGMPRTMELLRADEARLDALAAAIAPEVSRQSLSEKSAMDCLTGDLSPFFFRSPVQPLPRQGKGSFLVCPDIAKSADAFGRVDDIGYVFAHKCSNFRGGSQTMAQAELERIALASTFPKSRYDGFVLRSPERVLSRCAHAFDCRKTVLVLLQDGQGREEDMAHLQDICAPENLHPSLFVFADTTENFVMMQPMIHARMVGVDALTECQREVFDRAREKFVYKFPKGHNGFV